ncbi:hypothetical protein [Vibrio alginolyticus]|uniref:hypothetical protein n=1 Tax=Vibrio alginolyticus TaxID=663 RepID=UPI003755316D
MNSSDVTCFKTGLASLLDIELWLKWIEVASGLATTFALIVASIAAYIGYKQLLSNKEESRKATASSIYQQYLLLSMEYPQFSMGMEKPESRNDTYQQYCWFVSSMLFSFEQILETQNEDPQWLETIKSQLSRHKIHLATSSTVNNGHWDPILTKLIDDVCRR